LGNKVVAAVYSRSTPSVLKVASPLVSSGEVHVPVPFPGLSIVGRKCLTPDR
jgi:hypothetical protein